MRLIAGITTAALSGLAAAATQPSADVFVFQSSSWQSSPETPSIPKEVARHILLQRASIPRSLRSIIALADANNPVQISRQRYGSDLRDIPSSINTDAAVAHIARFGKSPAPLFTQPEKSDASQLVIFVEGAGADDTTRLRKQLGQQVAFTVADPPSATANNNLMSLFRGMGVASSQQCELSAVLNPFEADCWTGPSSVVKYDLRTAPKTVDDLFDNLSRLEKFVKDGDLEVLLAVFPESTRSSKLNHWSAAAAGASDLRRRRDAETVISDQEDTTNHATAKPAAARPGSSTPAAAAARRSKPLPQCFQSANSCMTQTNSCPATAASKRQQRQRDHVSRRELLRGRKTVHWGGNMCQKEDISVPFWLIAGFTITIVGAVSFAIGLLFSVGEEQLPGVIGAGVSRSK
ncbi:hypothetical protein NEMBOFW57_003743 [Staphylotrichum longicolle]|uniref:Vacuolar sorting protein Vps3844 C-terminal domain-containing protein n=1 Tax=Staphylotrichum longicolle TaxID=669026 RepID=A0AAD4I302_9PEZI|nr:hypothetical protein NEMBOFW57_003743 [Staphylotrichum longicolle]